MFITSFIDVLGGLVSILVQSLCATLTRDFLNDVEVVYPTKTRIDIGISGLLDRFRWSTMFLAMFKVCVGVGHVSCFRR